MRCKLFPNTTDSIDTQLNLHSVTGINSILMEGGRVGRKCWFLQIITELHPLSIGIITENLPAMLLIHTGEMHFQSQLKPIALGLH